MGTICESEVLNCLPTRHESTFMSDANVDSGEIAESRCGGNLPRPLHNPSLSLNISLVFIFIPGFTFTSFHKALYSIPNIEFCKSFAVAEQRAASSEAKMQTQIWYDKALVCAGRQHSGEGERQGERERAALVVGRESGESRLLLYTCASRERGTKSAVRGEPNVWETWSKIAQRARERERAYQSVCVYVKEWVSVRVCVREWVRLVALPVCVHKNGNKLTQCGARVVVVAGSRFLNSLALSRTRESSRTISLSLSAYHSLLFSSCLSLSLPLLSLSLSLCR